MELVGPTILACGTEEQQARYLRPLRRGDELWCQLFSEPGAGSDLAGAADHGRARRRRVGRQRPEGVDVGRAATPTTAASIARTDPDVPKHTGITTFLVDMRRARRRGAPAAPDDGGASFNEVFLTDVRVPDDRSRSASVDDGWRVRAHHARLRASGAAPAAAAAARPSGSSTACSTLARHLGKTDDPVVRQRLADVYIRLRRVRRSRPAGQGRVPGRAGARARGLDRQAARDAAAHERSAELGIALLGPRLVGRHAASGARSRGPSTSTARPATASPAAPTRSSATSSASASSACPGSRRDDTRSKSRLTSDVMNERSLNGVSGEITDDLVEGAGRPGRSTTWAPTPSSSTPWGTRRAAGEGGAGRVHGGRTRAPARGDGATRRRGRRHRQKAPPTRT